MSGLPVQEDKRFRRAHVAPGRRGSRLSRAGWARHAAAALMMTAAIYQLAQLVLTTNALAVRHVSIDGNVRMSRGEILGVLDGLQGRNILTLDLKAWRGRLLAAPWIADATVRRIFPGTIRVFVQEREPIGIGRLGDQLFLIDRTGTIIDEFGPIYANLDLPIIDGLSAGPRGGATLVDPVRAALAERLLISLERAPQLVRRLSQVDVSDARDAAVLLDGDPVVIRLGYEQFAERLQSYLDVAETLRDRVEDIDYVDLRFGEHVYVQPRARSVKNTLTRSGPALRRSKPAGE